MRRYTPRNHPLAVTKKRQLYVTAYIFLIFEWVYLAILTALVSRITVTFTCPG